MTRVLWLLPVIWALSAAGSPADDLTLVGEGRYRYLLWTVYDARLFAPQGRYRHGDTRPFVLELEYRRDFSAGQILEETRRQLRKVAPEHKAFFDQWLESLAGLIPDVARGDVITLHVDEHGHSHFLFNGDETGRIEDADFSSAFSAIWLSEDSSDPGFTSKLTDGENDSTGA